MTAAPVARPPAASAPTPSQEVRQGVAFAVEWRVAACLLLILAAAWGLRAYRSGTASYWFDESSSWKTIQYGWSEIWTPISRNVHPPCYYLVLKSWGLVFGDGPQSLRLFSATFGALSALAAFAFVREALAGSGVSRERTTAMSLLGAALIAVNGMHVFAGVHARMYPLGIFLALITAWMAVRVQRTGGNVRDWVILSVAGTALTLTHYYGLFTAASIGLWLLASLAVVAVREGGAPRTRRLATGLLLSAWGAMNVWGLWLSSFLNQRAQVSENYFIRPFEWDQLARMALAMLTGREEYGHMSDAAWWAAGVWLWIAMLTACFGGGAGRLAALGATLPVACAAAYCLQVRSIFSPRYFLFAQTYLLAGWPLLLARLPTRLLPSLLGVATVAWFSYWTAGHLEDRDRRSQQHGLRDAAVLLDEWRSSGDAAIVGQGVIHPTIQQYARAGRDRIYVLDRGRPYPHYQGGPLLRDSEYLSVEALEAMNIPRVFTVDIYDLWRRGSRFETRLEPARWKKVREHWFREEYGQPCRIFVREYERIDSPPAVQTYIVQQ